MSLSQTRKNLHVILLPVGQEAAEEDLKFLGYDIAADLPTW